MTANVLNIGETDLRNIIFTINQLAKGRSNAVGSVTLTANVTTTTVTAVTCGAGSTPILTPTSAHASAEFGNGTIYISSVANGSFVITHANSAQTDRTYLYAVLG